MKIIKLELIRPFIDAGERVLNDMLSIHAKAGQIILKERPYPLYEVSAMLGIHGDVEGVIVLSMSKEASAKVVIGLLGNEISDGERLTADAVGEVLNIIVGAGKGQLEGNIGCGIPSVIIGTGHTVWQPRDIPSALIKFETDWGDMALEVNFKTD
ncbi:chemotaxis protein CheX [Planctomycetota bacterium]